MPSESATEITVFEISSQQIVPKCLESEIFIVLQYLCKFQCLDACELLDGLLRNFRYRKVPQFSDARKSCCNLTKFKLKTKT